MLLNKKVLIVGAGISGKGLYTFLKSQNVNVEIFDDKFSKNLNNLDNFDEIYFSPGVKMSHPLWQIALSTNIKIINDLDIFFNWKSNAKIIAVTGTSGKTTTCCMISHILEVNKIKHHLCGNMGVDIFVDSDIYVLEVSSLVLDRTQKFACDIGIITNIAVDHLDVHECYEKYVNAKLNITRQYINKDQKFYFGPGSVVLNKNQLQIFNDLPIPNNIIGKHNIQNAIIASSVCIELGCKAEDVIQALKTFMLRKYNFAEYRQIEYKINDLIIVNDSKSTNLLSLKAALDNYDNITLILGGLIKTGYFDITIIKDLLYKVKKIYIFGRDSDIFMKQFNNIPTEKFDLLEDVVKKISHTKPTGVILFSPCGTSFDYYKSYTDRGRHFESLVNKYFL